MWEMRRYKSEDLRLKVVSWRKEVEVVAAGCLYGGPARLQEAKSAPSRLVDKVRLGCGRSGSKWICGGE
jgi:hypothetical protein